jgi:hypothetical protein
MPEPRDARVPGACKRQRDEDECQLLPSLASLISAVASAGPPPKAGPNVRASPALQYVSPELRLLPPHNTTALTPAARHLAQEQACVVRAEDPLLQQLLEVRIITTHRPAEASPLSNHISLRVHKEYGTMVHHERTGRSPAEAVMFCFMASDQLEPIIVAVVVHPELGRLQYITDTQLQQLEVAIGQLKHRFKLDGETYSYTGAKELLAGSWHSRHFHLKICIPTEMYLQIFPAMQVIARKRHLLEPFKRKWEPLAYKFESQSTAPWPEVRRLMQVDIEGRV